MYTGRYFEFMNRRRLFVHFTGLSERFYSKNGVGKSLSYFMNDVTTVREAISMGINQTVNSSILLVSTIVMSLITNVPLYLVARASRFAADSGHCRLARTDYQEKVTAGTGSAGCDDGIGGGAVWRDPCHQEVRGGRHDEAAFWDDGGPHPGQAPRLVRVSSLFQSIIPFLGATSLIIALLFGGYLTILGRITVGNFVALTLYIRMLMNPLQRDRQCH